MISGRVAPFGRRMRSRILVPLLSARGLVASLIFAVFAAAVTLFFVAALFFVPLAGFWPLGAPFFLVAPFLTAAVSGATWAPCSAPAAAVSAVGGISAL